MNRLKKRNYCFAKFFNIRLFKNKNIPRKYLYLIKVFSKEKSYMNSVSLLVFT